MTDDERSAYPPPRPVWVAVVFVVYVMLASAVLLGPVVLAGVAAVDEPNNAVGYLVAASVYFLVVFAGGASLLVIPVRAAWATPHRKRRIWLPLVGSSVLAAALFAGFGVAALELAVGGGAAFDATVWVVLAVLPVAWLVWLVLFWAVSRSTDPLTWNGRLYKALLAGSVLELVVAVPMHLIVRRRDECCAGMYTATGIGVGLVVAVIALGPAVIFLFFRRHKQVYGKR